jgi:hypothetical protein
MDSVVEVDDGDHTLTSQVSPTEIYVEGQRRDPTSRRIADRTLDLPSCRRELTATPSVCPRRDVMVIGQAAAWEFDTRLRGSDVRGMISEQSHEVVFRPLARLVTGPLDQHIESQVA